MKKSNGLLHNYTNFKFVDIALGDPGARNHIVDISKVKKLIIPNQEAYCTYHRFDASYHDHVAQTGSVSGYRGPSYCDFIPFDFDNASQPEQAQSDARDFCHYLNTMYELDLDALKYYYSGYKGFHILIPTTLFGIEPSTDLAGIIKRIAGNLCNNVDPQIYDQNRLLRITNTINNKSGRYKIQLSAKEFMHLPMATILDFARSPRTEQIETTSAIEPHPEFVTIFQQAQTDKNRNGSYTPARPIEETIPQGQRNNTLTSLAGTLRRRGLSEAVIYTTLQKTNTSQCHPPLSNQEVERITKSISKYPASVPLNGSLKPETMNFSDIHTTDSGNAEVIAKLYGARLRYDHARKGWLVWNGHYWKADELCSVEQMALKAARERLKASADIEEESIRKKQANWAIMSEDRRRIKAALEMAASMKPLATIRSDFDQEPYLLCCENGVVNLKTGDFRPGKPSDMISMSTGINYNPNADSPLWESTVAEVFDHNPEMIHFFQKAIGYSITGSTKEQKVFFNVGHGENGKGVLMNTIYGMLGDYAANTPFSTFLASSRDGDRIPNDIAALFGKRLVMASEVKEFSTLNEASIKSLSGGDPVSARFMRGEWFTFQPRFKIWLSVNHRPKIRDNSNGMWRRIRVLEFERTFSGENRDDDLPDKLREEYPGILNWAIQGSLMWQREGLKEPEKILQATNAYRTEMDVISLFLEDCTVNEEEIQVGSAALFEAYMRWCDQNNEFKMTHTMFGRKMGELGFEKKRVTINGGKKMGYLGIGLLHEE